MVSEYQIVRQTNQRGDGVRHGVSGRIAPLGVPTPRIVFDILPHCPNCGSTEPALDMDGFTVCCQCIPCTANDEQWHIKDDLRACCPGILIRQGIFIRPPKLQNGDSQRLPQVIEPTEQEEEELDRRGWLRARRRLKKKLQLGKMSEPVYWDEMDKLGPEPQA